jgi:hypothetical protein
VLCAVVQKNLKLTTEIRKRRNSPSFRCTAYRKRDLKLKYVSVSYCAARTIRSNRSTIMAAIRQEARTVLYLLTDTANAINVELLKRLTHEGIDLLIHVKIKWLCFCAGALRKYRALVQHARWFNSTRRLLVPFDFRAGHEPLKLGRWDRYPYGTLWRAFSRWGGRSFKPTMTGSIPVRVTASCTES